VIKGIAVVLLSLMVSFFAVATFVNAQTPTTATPAPTTTTMPSGAPSTGF